MWPIITRELDALGLPEELGYLAWVESLMDPSAANSRGSVGLWQFLPETARAYGLHVGGAVDERADPARSSHAAAQLLADRFAEFGGDATLIAVVSYNLGDVRTRALLHSIAMEKGSWRSGHAATGTLPNAPLPREAMGTFPSSSAPR